MDLDQLRNFLAVARIGNFTAAADSVGISQPAISRSIARLEADFGQPLLERGTRQVTLTDAGTLLHGRAQQVLMILEDAKAEINDDGQTGRIRVGAIPTIAPYLLPSLLRDFSSRFPAAHVGVEEDTTKHLSKRLTNGEIDVAIMALPIAEKYLEVETLFEEELLVVMPADHALAEKKQIRVSDIESLPFVLLGEAHCLSDSVVSFCRGRSFQPVALERTSQLTTVQELVALGHGVSMIPAMARKLDKSKTRIYRSLTGTKPKRTIAACWNPYRFQSKLLESFREILRSSTL
jgi:LysR family hydrogen peroxide-inducible transcriptional activator